MNVSDADRERVIALLREQAGEGRLDMDEFGQRLDEAYQATTLDQLQHALRELPVPAVLPPPQERFQQSQALAPKPPPSSIGRDTRTRSHRPHRAAQTPIAARAAVAEAAWKGHVYTYIWVNLLLVAIWVMTGADYDFWPMWSIVPWGVGLAAHGTAHRAGVRARQAKQRRELEGG